MKKIIRITESDLIKIVKQSIVEDYSDDPSNRLFVPEEFDGAIMELGSRPTPGTVIDVFNDIFQGDASNLVDFNKDLFLFYNEDGDDITPEEIYEMIDDFVKDEDDSWYDENN